MREISASLRALAGAGAGAGADVADSTSSCNVSCPTSCRGGNAAALASNRATIAAAASKGLLSVTPGMHTSARRRAQVRRCRNERRRKFACYMYVGRLHVANGRPVRCNRYMYGTSRIRPHISPRVWRSTGCAPRRLTPNARWTTKRFKSRRRPRVPSGTPKAGPTPSSSPLTKTSRRGRAQRLRPAQIPPRPAHPPPQPESAQPESAQPQPGSARPTRRTSNRTSSPSSPIMRRTPAAAWRTILAASASHPTTSLPTWPLPLPSSSRRGTATTPHATPAT